MKATTKTETVKVAIRVRPMNTKEKQMNSSVCVDVDKTLNQVGVKKQDTSEIKTFQYDYVYPTNATQREIYDDIGFPLVESVLQGYNGTIFAYGQTGCGKTFTMMGDYNNPELRGIIPNSFSHIFGYINAEGNSKRFLLRCSFLEIYNEEIRDLLGADCTRKLEVREDPKKGIYVKDLNIRPVKTPKDIDDALAVGNKNRHVGETSMNQESSRSHCIFSVYIEIEDIIGIGGNGGANENEDSGKTIRSGKLNLVDLAGSERQSKTKSEGKTFDEAKKINLSLTALSNVIDALSSNRQHVPYRDSKLTRLLQDSLGGNTKTVMVAAVSPSSFNCEETLGTLRYAARANAIKNIPKINEDPKDAIIRQYEDTIKELKMQLEGRVPNALGQLNVPDLSKLEIENKNLFEERLKMEQVVELSNLEKEKLLNKLKDMENNMMIGGVVGNEKEGKKFKEYREKQLKQEEEVEKKHQLMEEKKKLEEESLQNDVIKLRNRVKYLQSEIRDIEYENERDKVDLLENVKELNKETLLYKGMLRMILAEYEIKKVIELSKYDEDNGDWKICPFSFREKTLNLPRLKQNQIADFVENEINSRELVIEQEKRVDTKMNKFMSSIGSGLNGAIAGNGQNGGNVGSLSNGANIGTNNPNSFANGMSNVNGMNGGYGNRVNGGTKRASQEDTPKAKLEQTVPRGTLEPMVKQTKTKDGSMIVINRKEAKKFEDMLKGSHLFGQQEREVINNMNNNTVNRTKVGKVVLAPITYRNDDKGFGFST